MREHVLHTSSIPPLRHKSVADVPGAYHIIKSVHILCVVIRFDTVRSTTPSKRTGKFDAQQTGDTRHEYGVDRSC